MAMPSGRSWTVRRADHQLRKILPDDRVTFEVTDEDGAAVRRIELRGSEIRGKGLWKDITNKALGGLPGLQKEGTDGVVTSAEFILYPEYEAKRTLCLEFFGPDFDEASHVILSPVAGLPLPERRARGALRARALRRRVRPGHQLQGEGPPRGDAEGGPARRRGRPRARRGGAGRREDPRHPRRAPEHPHVRGARRGGGQAVLGRPQEARRHRAAHQRLQDERGRGPPAGGARRVRPLRRGHERRGGALRAGALHRSGRRGIVSAAAPPPDDPEWLAAKIPAALQRFEGARARIAAAAPAELRSLADPAHAPRRGLPARPRLHRPRPGPRRSPTRRSASGSSSSPPTCTPATATCT